MVRIVGPVVGPREGRELGGRLRRDQMGAAVDRAAVVPPVPGAADRALTLVAVDVEALFLEVLDRREAAAAGADDAHGVAAVIAFTHGYQPPGKASFPGRAVL